MAIPSLSPPALSTFLTKGDDEPLRPTRQAVMLGDGSAPVDFGIADHVAVALARFSNAAPISTKETSAQSAHRRTALIVARFQQGMLVEPLVSSLESRALEVRKLETVSTELPANLGDAFQRIVRMAAVSSATLGFLGALACSMLLSGEALVPSVGWIPGPIMGAAIGAGVFGALGFLLGALAMLLVPSMALRHAPRGAVFVIVRARAFDLEAIIGRVVDAGGTITAVGEG
ncbi:MAG: hypothetical protein ABI175_21095 [Polyangiales bacterium]